MLRDRLVCGVRYVGIQKRLLAEKDLTYEKAYELALTMEAAERDTKDLKPDSGRTEVHRGEVHSIQSWRGRKDSSRKRGKPRVTGIPFMVSSTVIASCNSLCTVNNE